MAFNAWFLSLVTALILMVFQEPIRHLLRDLPLRRFRESRLTTILLQRLLLEELHNDASQLVLWFLRTTMFGVVSCYVVFFVLYLLALYEHLHFDTSRWVFVSGFLIACSTLPTLVRLSDYENTMKNLERLEYKYCSDLEYYKEAQADDCKGS
jgi:hypothetical protein